MVKPITDTI